MNSNLSSIPSMSFSVRRFSESFVTPCETTPCKTLQLSSMDTLPLNRFLVDVLLVFKHGIEPAEIIRQALSKALVPYYPVAGEFSVSKKGEMEVACTARGVWFVEASSNHTLNDFNFFDCPYTILKHHLIPPPPPQIIDPTDVIIMLQVTHFKCDGFVVGLRFNHVMFDGVGVGQFMQAIGEMARDHEGTKLKIEPVWNRVEMPKVPQSVLNIHSFAGHESIENKTMDISLDHINQLKNKFIEQTGGKRCSTFEVIVTKIMRSRLRAIKTDLDVQVQLVFPVNLRNKCLHNVMPRGGYYGNFLYIKEVEARCREIVDGSFSDVVELIQDAKRGVSDEFKAWVDGGYGDNNDAFINYEKLMVNDWSKIGLESVDYGWGVPQSVIPVRGPSLIPECMITASSQGGKKCIHLMTKCVKKEHLDAFLDEMMNTDVDVV